LNPQCSAIAIELQADCTLQAVAGAKTGQILLKNPKPGTRGTLGRNTLELPGQWNFDAAMSRTVRITETKTLQVRFDATNVFNHPVPNLVISTNNPPAGLNINSSVPFWFIQ